MRKDTRARAITIEVKRRVAARDSFDGWPCCVNCGAAAPEELCWSNAHVISRAQGGLGCEENIVTLCPLCHRRYDQTTERSKIREHLREYLMGKYPGWDEDRLVQRKERLWGTDCHTSLRTGSQ